VNLRQQLINDRIEQTAKTLTLSEDEAFLRLSHSIVTSTSLHSFELGDRVDGGQDKQIDTITIDQDGEEAVIHVIQVKNTETFSSNIVIQIRNGLDWIFRKKKADVGKITNVALRDKITECRSLIGKIGPSNVQLFVHYVTNSGSNSVSAEFQQEAETLKQQYDNDTFERFEFRVWSAHELVDEINRIERTNRKIDADIPIRYDANNPSLVKYHAEGLKGIICTADAKEIAKIVNDDATGSVFDSNIRQFLGSRGAVNTEIRRTCTEPHESHLFWFLNNGITIVCDSADAVTDPDNAHVKVKNMQVVNGCQTATTLAMAAKEGALLDARVLLRIYQSPSTQLTDKIVLTTNNQNRINSRDLRANDKIQVDMEQGFKLFGYHYERKMRQFDKLADIDAAKIMPNELVAQSYLAIVLKSPSDARRRKYKVWGELYEKIFGGQPIAPYILATKIVVATSSWSRKSTYISDRNDLRRKLAKNGTFHIARIAAYTYRGNDVWTDVAAKAKSQIEEIEKSTKVLDAHIKRAFHRLEKIISDDQNFRKDLDGAMKSGALDNAISKSLHIRKSKSKNSK
jgi:hypothetical protein